MKRRPVAAVGLGLGVWLALSCGSPGIAWCWGAEGHQAICEIAYRELTPGAAAKLNALVALDPGIASFRLGCVWPDFEGPEQDARRAEHYINLPRTWSAIRDAKCPQNDVCLFTAIRHDSGALVSKQSSAEQKLVALRFLGHWVGDLHQPLHVSYGDDRGGNDILLRKDLGCRRNLHDVWDNCLPEGLMRKMGAGGGAGAFGRALAAEITPQERAAWQATADPLDWANESFAAAREPTVRYCVRTDRGCDYSKTQVRFDGRGRRRSENLSRDYEDREEAVVRQRLKQAGVRLGALLEKLLARL